ncbi:MAG: hypothetical protein EXR05_00980 [Acetobacteraceae bacterium]|nr:hypothetical protein [Acetobacteraceae bacterium]
MALTVQENSDSSPELCDTTEVLLNIAAPGIHYFAPDLDNLTGEIITVNATTLGLVSGCNLSAFAPLEHVTAMATDGWTRLSYLDRADFEAFTLSKGS